MNQKFKPPYSDVVWDEVELWSRDRLETYQLQALRRQLAYVAQNSTYYRRVFAEIGFDPASFETLDDLRRLPFTRKTDYLDGIEAEPPYGTLAAVAPGEAVRIHFSSGTTAAPTPMLWTQSDLDRWADLYARYFYAQGLRRGDVLQCMFNYAWFVGGLGATLAAQRVGALVIPGSSGDTKRQIETIERYKTRCVVGTPSFMAHIAEVAEQMGVSLPDSSVEMVCVGGEPGASIPGTRERIEAMWGARMYDCYGALECQPIAWDTAAQDGPRIAEDYIYAEVLDPQTHQPVAEGQRGALVITHLDKRACPLIRWWTGDMVVRTTQPTADGRTHSRLPGGVLGRTDDMLIIRGVNIFPTAVEDILRSFPELTGEYQIVLDKSVQDPVTGFLTGARVRAETAEPSEELKARLEAVLREKLKARFNIELNAPGSLPRSVHKARRVIRE